MGSATTDRVIGEARAAHRNVVARRSIGTKSHALKMQHVWGKVSRIAIAGGAVLVGAGVAGAVVDGIGFTGVMLTTAGLAATTGFFLWWPPMKRPTVESLKQEKLDVLAGKTEIWLEQQRPMLPAPAVQLIDNIGTQLDALAPQLQRLDENSEAARNVRTLVGEHLPGLITGYQAIPAQHRHEKRGGRTAEEQLINGLGVIEREIAGATRSLAEGKMDELATRERFLELKYQGMED